MIRLLVLVFFLDSFIQKYMLFSNVKWRIKMMKHSAYDKMMKFTLEKNCDQEFCYIKIWNTWQKMVEIFLQINSSNSKSFKSFYTFVVDWKSANAMLQFFLNRHLRNVKFFHSHFLLIFFLLLIFFENVAKKKSPPHNLLTNLSDCHLNYIYKLS